MFRLRSPQFLDIFQVADENFVVNCCSQTAGPEEVHTVQVRDVHSPERLKETPSNKSAEKENHMYKHEDTHHFSLPLIGLRAVGPILLHMHAKEADVCSINVLKCKKGFGPVREGLGHLSTVHKSGVETVIRH